MKKYRNFQQSTWINFMLCCHPALIFLLFVHVTIIFFVCIWVLCIIFIAAFILLGFEYIFPSFVRKWEMHLTKTILTFCLCQEESVFVTLILTFMYLTPFSPFFFFKSRPHRFPPQFQNSLTSYPKNAAIIVPEI